MRSFVNNTDMTLSEPDILLIYVTFPDAEAAEHLARLAVEGRLAACANILGTIRSVFSWNGYTESADETALLLKTRAECYEALEALIRVHHPYECPCILGLPVTSGLPAFLQWIREETTPPQRDA